MATQGSKTPAMGSVNVLPALGNMDAIIGCSIAGLFLGLSVVDASVAMGPNSADLLPHYLRWKSSGDMPIVSPFMLLMVVMLPLEVWRAVKEDVMGLVSRPAGFARHAIGVAALCVMATLITLIITTVAPAEKAMAQSEGPADPAALAHLVTLYQALVVANLVSLILGAVKIGASQVPGAPTVEHLAAQAADKKKE